MKATDTELTNKIDIDESERYAHLQNKCFVLKFKFQRNASKFPIFI